MSEAPYRFTRSARAARSVILTAVWLMLCLQAYVIFEAHPGIVGVLAVFALPSLYEIAVGATSVLEVDDREVRWHSGHRSGAMPRGTLKSVRLDTRLDFSLRLTLQTHQGGKLRLPYECVPPAAELTQALTRHDIPFERHHFALMG